MPNTPFALKYDQNTKEAVATALVDGGMTARQVRAALAAGQLIGCGPCDMPLSTVSETGRRERKRRQGDEARQRSRRNPTGGAKESLAKLQAATDLEIDRLSQKALADKHLDLDKAELAAKLLERLANVAVKLEPKHARPTAGKARRPADDPEARLQKAHKASLRAVPDKP